MTLHLYIARRFLSTFGMVFGLFAGVIYLVNIVEGLRTLPTGVGAGQIIGITLLTVPEAVYQILPLITAIAAVSLFINLARTSELVVTRASGRSAMRSLAAPVAVTILLGGLMVAILNPIVAATSRAHEIRMAALSKTGSSSYSVSDEGLWLRQGGDGGQTVIHASHADLDGTKLQNVTFLGLGPDGGPSFRINGDSAVLQRGRWEIQDAKVWKLSGSKNPELDAVTHKTLDLPTALTREQIRDSFGTPSAISFWDLPKFIGQLESAGFSALKYRTWYQSQLALPLTMAAMVMIGAAFTLRHTRMGRTGLMVLLAMLGSFTLFFLDSFGAILAQNGQIPATLGAWVPPVAGILLPLGLLLHLEDG